MCYDACYDGHVSAFMVGVKRAAVGFAIVCARRASRIYHEMICVDRCANVSRDRDNIVLEYSVLHLPYVDLGGPVPYSPYSVYKSHRTGTGIRMRIVSYTSYVHRAHLVDVIASGDAQNPWSEVARGRAWMWYDIADA